MTTRLSPASPIAGQIAVLEAPAPAGPDGKDGELIARTELVVAPTEPVFVGHYPDFPIFPGVCLIETVQLSARAVVHPEAALELAAVESARFRGPVYPGDRVTVTMRWIPRGDEWVCSARLEVVSHLAAEVRLRYRSAVGEQAPHRRIEFF
ncbi:3-hydroxyacyl-ACP dehydratase FabZ family protein [Micromonospora sp. DT201]|uniref:3-hydroxyacyl-ACP dehydratase FabZ family protein n=1 Tax=Micromonospora sp. DT201 TaxID=3393442 RepID=UPI003CF19CDB